ncbi:hypothetical protein TYRP_011753 [Tyrophagus putrescentiae]|nr:hypothetical protein TYRP_011753 [Tyrophagus putrescentiae]
MMMDHSSHNQPPPPVATVPPPAATAPTPTSPQPPSSLSHHSTTTTTTAASASAGAAQLPQQLLNPKVMGNSLEDGRQPSSSEQLPPQPLQSSTSPLDAVLSESQHQNITTNTSSLQHSPNSFYQQLNSSSSPPLLDHIPSVANFCEATLSNVADENADHPFLLNSKSRNAMDTTANTTNEEEEEERSDHEEDGGG